MQTINFKGFNKMYYLLILLFYITILTGCSKSDNTATTANPYGGANGQTTFWASNAGAVYPITVNVGGKYIGTIGAKLSAAPDCQNASNNVVKYVDAPGTYNFICTAPNNTGNWTGSFTITTAGCYAAELK